MDRPGRPAPHRPEVADADRWRQLGDVLARGFEDDPVWRYLVPDDRRWAVHLGAVFGRMLRRSAEAGTTWTTSADEGVAVWAAPGTWRTPWSEVLRSAPTLVRGFGPGGLPRALRALGALEAGHPEEPHWYLEFLATEPHLRGKGLGTALLAPVLERCDAEGLPAYLESSKRENLPFYARFGFEVTEELPTGGRDAPPCWRMWRDPR